jgi:NAD(P)-dependent dehydrogenase (short-subunit alcohol dehydrogenase family)
MSDGVVARRGAVLVTGTDSGIGAACAVLLDRLGYQVFAGVLTQESLHALAKSRGPRITHFVLDVTNPDDIAAAVRTVSGVVGETGLAALVNNAGFAIGGPIENLPLDIMRRQLEVNFLGQMAMTQAFLPLIRAAAGRIINMGSPSGTLVLPFLSPYAASKAAVKAMTESLRLELRPWRIPVSLVEPGRIVTDIWRQSTEDSAALLTQYPADAALRYGDTTRALVRMNTSAGAKGLPPESVAKVVAGAIAARWPRARYYVGMDARILTLAAHIVPTQLRDWVIARALTHFTGSA